MRVDDSLGERLTGRTTTTGSPTSRAEATARTAGLRGEQVIAERQDPFGGESPQVRTCWMCGIRMPVGRMVADGGNACPDVRWYCRDTWGCTQRWTSHSARLTAIRPGEAEPETSGEQLPSPEAAKPMPAMTGLRPGNGKPLLCELSQLQPAIS